MKTIVHIELSDEQLSRLADLIDGKTSKRRATRKEVQGIALSSLEGVLAEPVSTPSQPKISAEGLKRPPEAMIKAARELLGRSFNEASYIRGYNKLPIRRTA